LASCEAPIPVPEDCTLPEDDETSVQQEQVNTKAPVEPRVCTVPEREEGANLEVNPQLRDFAPDKEQKMLNAIERLKIVINSKEFKQRILDHKYQNKNSFVDNQGLTNEEIYEVLMLGAETLIPEKDGEMDVDITLYYKNNSTVGYTYPDTNRIWVNDKFFATYSLGKVAANVVHEWSHKVGFEHDFSRTEKRNFSVPYGVGTIIRELVDAM
jgi:hypothetical protein